MGFLTRRLVCRMGWLRRGGMFGMELLRRGGVLGIRGRRFGVLRPDVGLDGLLARPGIWFGAGGWGGAVLVG
jgi:hypothetical protein